MCMILGVEYLQIEFQMGWRKVTVIILAVLHLLLCLGILMALETVQLYRFVEQWLNDVRVNRDDWKIRLFLINVGL